jgi:hypothetical protein
MKIKLSKSQWEQAGRIAGWIKQAKTLVDNQVDSWIEMEGGKLKEKLNEPRIYKEVYQSEDKQLTLEVTYEKFYELISDKGHGYGFPCAPDGRLTIKPSPDAIQSIKNGKYKDPVVVKMGHEIRSGCGCGSGLQPRMEYDARGIELGNMCNKCKKDRLSKYRPEVLNNPQYEADEPIDQED